jgi:hypothetical protein|tara:strand:- start:3545 stop:3739 length:195 start_codon:yes stop_codon:yes gene_type:complete
MKIKKKKLVKYLKEWAKASEKDAEQYSESGDFSRAYQSIIISDFIKDDLIDGIEYDFNNELNGH